MVNQLNLLKSGNILIEGPHKKPIIADITYLKDGKKKPVIVFSHGFKGFKDWGHFNLMADRFAMQGFVFLKFNFSHNGTSPEVPDDFVDLEAFANNNFTKELDDLGKVIDWLVSADALRDEANPDLLYLVGHSRGGSISILKTNEDPRVKKLVTWASPSTFENKFQIEEIKHWKKHGVIFVENARTNQQMPLYYQIVEDYFNNKHRIHLETATQNLNVPCLFVQGTADDVVPLEEGKNLHLWSRNSRLLVVENGDHTFGAEHPFNLKDFPGDFKLVFENTCTFLKSDAHIKA